MRSGELESNTMNMPLPIPPGIKNEIAKQIACMTPIFIYTVHIVLIYSTYIYSDWRMYINVPAISLKDYAF